MCFLLGVGLALGAPSSVDPAHAQTPTEPSLTAEVPDDAVEGPWDDYYLLPTDPGSRTSYSFGGDAAGSQEYFVRVTGILPDGTDVTVCESPTYDPGEVRWVCWYDVPDQGPMPTMYGLMAEMIVPGSSDSEAMASLGILRTLGSPDVDSRIVSSDGQTAVLSGTRVEGMGVEVYDGRLFSGSPPVGAEPLCSDLSWSRPDWSCEVDTSELEAGTHTYSVRHVPIEGDPAGIEYPIASAYRWVEVVQPEPEPEPELEPEPTPEPEPSPDPTPEPTREPTPEQDPAPDPPTTALPPVAAAPDTPPVPSPAPGLTEDPTDEPTREPTEDPTPPPPPDPGHTDEPDEDTTTSPPSQGGAAGMAAAQTGATPGGGDGGAAAPSTYGHALPAAVEVVTDPPVLGGAALTAVGFLVLVALPSELLHATLRSNYAQAFAFLAGWRRRGARWLERVTLPAWAAAGLVLAAGALVAVLAKGDFGGAGVTARLWLAMLLAFVTTNGLGVALGWVLGARYGARPRPTLMPGFILLTAAGALVSRMFGLQPAIIFGVLIMTTFAGTLNRQQRGKLAAAICGTFTLIGTLAWLGHGTIEPAAAGFGAELLREYLTTLLTGAIGYCVVALLPLTFLDGQRIVRWSKPAWALLYAVVIALFLLAVAPLPGSWQEATGAALRWCGAFGAFGLVSIAVWAWFRFRTARSP